MILSCSILRDIYKELSTNGTNKMTYKYNIKHKKQGKVETINFKNKKSMLKYLDSNMDKLNKLISPVLNFGPVMLPLKQTVWKL